MTHVAAFDIDTSDIDTQRFGVRIARTPHLSHQHLDAANTFCAEHAVHLLIARCPTTDVVSVPLLEADGFRLMETLIYWRKRLRDIPVVESQPGVIIRDVQQDDVDAVVRIATLAFKDYVGHYNADPRLAKEQCAEAYVSWATRSCTEPGVADGTLVAVRDEEVVGFLVMKNRTEAVSEGILAAVRPDVQGERIYPMLIVHAMQWMKDRGFRFAEASTQIINRSSSRPWPLLGFRIERSYYTFHKWYDEIGR